MPARADLHRHLEGSLRVSTVLELARIYRVDLPASSAGALRELLTVEKRPVGFHAFLGKFRWPMSVLGGLDACRRVAREAVEDAAAEGLAYLELRFSPFFMAEAHGLDPGGVAEVVLEGLEEGSRATGLPVAAIGILSRGYGPEAAWKEWLVLKRFRARLAAVDLAGDERRFPARLFERHFRDVREAGLGVTIHAGEAAGAESVRDAVEVLGATRIGHGVRAADDPSVLDLLLERRVGIECCLTSNLQTAAVPSLAAHPLREFLEMGLLATLATDDPAISGITLAWEIEHAAPEAGLSSAQVRRALLNARTMSFCAWHPPDGEGGGV